MAAAIRSRRWQEQDGENGTSSCRPAGIEWPRAELMRYSIFLVSCQTLAVGGGGLQWLLLAAIAIDSRTRLKTMIDWRAFVSLERGEPPAGRPSGSDEGRQSTTMPSSTGASVELGAYNTNHTTKRPASFHKLHSPGCSARQRRRRTDGAHFVHAGPQCAPSVWRREQTAPIQGDK
jgi:hypothetical protein